MPPDLESAARVVAEGVLLKLGDLILMTSPATMKKGGLIVVILIRRMTKKKTGGKKP